MTCFITKEGVPVYKILNKIQYRKFWTLMSIGVDLEDALNEAKQHVSRGRTVKSKTAVKSCKSIGYLFSEEYINKLRKG